MKNGVFIDGNVWNFVLDRKLDLAIELPADEFSICHTREAEFEIPVGKLELDVFITSTLARCNIQTGSYLGFADDSKPADEQRFGGFDVGRFASDEQIAFIASEKASSVVRPTKLQKREADISLWRRDCSTPSC